MCRNCVVSADGRRRTNFPGPPEAVYFEPLAGVPWPASRTPAAASRPEDVVWEWLGKMLEGLPHYREFSGKVRL